MILSAITMFGLVAFWHIIAAVFGRYAAKERP